MTIALTACTSYQVSESPTLNKAGRWVIMPISNQSTTPMAGQHVEQILSSIMFNKGVTTESYPANLSSDLSSLLDESANQKKADEWLRAQKFDYILSGSVQEWHYKTGLDGEPAVGITLQLVATDTGTVVWKSSGSRAGWGRESVSSAGHTVIENILDGLELE